MSSLLTCGLASARLRVSEARRASAAIALCAAAKALANALAAGREGASSLFEASEMSCCRFSDCTSSTGELLMWACLAVAALYSTCKHAT